MKKRSLISITDLSREEILKIMEFAAEFEHDLVDDQAVIDHESCCSESEKRTPGDEKPLMFCEEIQQKLGLSRRNPTPKNAGIGGSGDVRISGGSGGETGSGGSQKPRQRGEGSLGLLRGKIIATLFFEPSTRTRLSFESAINRLGARVIGFSDVANTSVSKGETLHDTISVISNYCDMIVMRHTLEGAARYASEVAKVPVVNAGDGANQHPSQTLLDLYSIKKTQGRLEGLKVMMVGDLKYGRTVHSLLQALSLFGAEFVFVSPPELRMPAEYRSLLDRKGLKYSEISELEGRMNDVDILYMTRIQKERFNDPMEYERVKNTYVLRPEMLEGVRDTMKILHPLPRVGEILQEVDRSPHAYYFSQVENGVYARMAIICFLLGITREF